VEASRNFANKIWNAARFLLMNLKSNEEMPLPSQLALEDKWILSKYNELVRDVTDNLDKYELGLAVAKLYDFIWDVFCDWYIELCKSRLNGEDEAAANTARSVLVYVFTGVLKLLHPFMPFITEEIWQSLPHSGESIMVSEWPEYKEELNFGKEAEDFEKVIAVIRAIRNRRSEMNVPPSKKAKICIASPTKDIFEAGASFISRLASGSSVEVADSFDMPDAVLVVTDSAKVYIPLNELVDFTAELARLEKELEAANKDKAFYEGKLNNPGFVAKAPEAVVNQQRDLLSKTLDRIALLSDSIAKIKAQI
ncbi:MAG: class I tRNA ligase family protein, partial [Acutalibacteraceae bacterium]|nr:class I tRNA ligase family protein [Acutalibacteraceae bacterium]